MTDSHSGTKVAFVEVIYEGDHCIPCVYMAEVVEEAVKKFGDRVKWTKVVLKRKPGVQRYAELSVKNQSVGPIPSLFINEKLAFDMIPPVEDLENYLEKILNGVSGT
ncbi:MAG: thioredoxin family protein [Desulfobaccales bacterium]